MKKQNALMMQMAIFFIFVIVTFGMLVIYQKGNMLLYPKIKKELDTYFNEHYLSILKEVDKSELLFNFDDKSYKYVYQNKQNEKLSFELIYTKKKKIKSTYQQDYVEGKSFLNSLSKDFQKEIQKILKKEELSPIKVENQMILSDLKKKEKEKLLSKKERTKVAFYQVEFSKTISSLNAKEMVDVLTRVDELLKKKSYHPLSYQVQFTLQSDGTKGFILKNVTRKTLLEGKLETIINQLYQNEKTKDENTGIEMEELK